jgi:hypothetical protein
MSRLYFGILKAEIFPRRMRKKRWVRRLEKECWERVKVMRWKPL